jgi:DNA polymerase alpha subunit A
MLADISSAKRKREEDKAKKESMDKGISNYFTKGPVVAQPKAKVWFCI